MSKVDLSVFEKYVGGDNGSLSYTIYTMCNGDFQAPIEESFPDRKGRKYSDPTYREEIEKYRQKLKDATESVDYKHLEQNGGGEGSGEYCYGVFSLEGKIYRAEYSYYSHQGDDYDDIEYTLREVKLVQKMVNVYE